MSDFYYTSDFRTETDERGDIRTVSGDEQLAQQMIAVAGNTLRDVFSGGSVTPEEQEEFTGTVASRLATIDRIGEVQTVDISAIDRSTGTLSVTIRSDLAATTETFDI